LHQVERWSARSPSIPLPVAAASPQRRGNASARQCVPPRAGKEHATRCGSGRAVRRHSPPGKWHAIC